MGNYYIGVRLSPQKIQMGIYDRQSESCEFVEKENIRGVGCKENMEYLALVIQRELHTAEISFKDVRGIGISLPGEVDTEGKVYYCMDMGWGIVNVKALMEKILPVSVVVGSGRNMAVLGEQFTRKENAPENMLVFLLESELKGSILLQHRIITGEKKNSRNIGKLPMWKESGKYDEWNTLMENASFSEIVRKYEARCRLPVNEAQKFTMNDIYERCKQGEALACKVFEEAADSLAMGIGIIHHVIELDLVVLGGELTELNYFMADLVEKQYQKLGFGKTPEIIFTKLGTKAEILGCIKHIMESVESEKL